MIRISGEIPGYLSTEREFEGFRLTVEFKWGRPRTLRGRRRRGPAGSCITWREDKCWPSPSLECQFLEGGTGNILLQGSSFCHGGRTPAAPESDDQALARQEQGPHGAHLPDRARPRTGRTSGASGRRTTRRRLTGSGTPSRWSPTEGHSARPEREGRGQRVGRRSAQGEDRVHLRRRRDLRPEGRAQTDPPK